MMESAIGIETNKHFIIKVNGKNYTEYINRRVRFSGLVEVLEDLELAERICQEALNSRTDVHIRKLRRGLIVKFYAE